MLDKRVLLLAGALSAITLSLGGCAAEDEKGGRGAPEVGYVEVRQQPVPVTGEFSSQSSPSAGSVSGHSIGLTPPGSSPAKPHA